MCGTFTKALACFATLSLKCFQCIKQVQFLSSIFYSQVGHFHISVCLFRYAFCAYGTSGLCPHPPKGYAPFGIRGRLSLHPPSSAALYCQLLPYFLYRQLAVGQCACAIQVRLKAAEDGGCGDTPPVAAVTDRPALLPARLYV